MSSKDEEGVNLQSARRHELWAGSFEDLPNPVMWRYTASLELDMRLWREDIAVNRAHVRALSACGVVDSVERDLLLRGLERVAGELASGQFVWKTGDEDIHTAIERRLTEIAGDVGAKLHTGRSRNDQVATDMALWLKAAVADGIEGCAELIKAILSVSDRYPRAVLPGLTHQQPAQPILWSYQLAAHGFSLLRDISRFQSLSKRVDVSPLGAGALAGSSFPLDVAETAAGLGFASHFDNAMQATSDRDAVAEYQSAVTIAMVHCSRLAADIILWASERWVRLPDEWATGSSMLPQKRNPDVAELVRGRTGTMIGRLTGFLATLKGLPLAYARDLQEDKEVAFRTADTFSSTCEALSGLVAGLKPDESRMRAAAIDGETIAVDLAEQLVHLGVPFREAHAIVGRAVRLSRQRKVPLSKLSVERDLAHLHPLLTQLNIESLDVDGSISSKRSPGSTSLDDVISQLKALEHGMQEALEVANHIRPILDLG